MSLVATCPSCGTLFRVQLEQLEASAGWVRCGHCMSVFDAKSQFSESEILALKEPFDTLNSSIDESNLSFIHQAKKQAFWASSTTRSFFIVLSIMLVGLLLLQVLRHHSTDLARSWPSLKPLVNVICSTTNCTPRVTRQIEAWVIDNSSFQKIEANRFQLSLVLKNTSQTSLYLPHIELSLLGDGDNLLIRHVINTTVDLPDTVVSAGAERSLTFTVKPRVDTGTESVVNTTGINGYRLILFYP